MKNEYVVKIFNNPNSGKVESWINEQHKKGYAVHTTNISSSGADPMPNNQVLVVMKLQRDITSPEPIME